VKLSSSDRRVYEAVADRFVAGDSIYDLAEDYSKTEEQIEDILRVVLYARGVNLREQKAARKVAKWRG